MPELPEVETIRRELAPRLAGRRCLAVTVEWPRMIEFPSLEAFCRGIVGNTIEGVDRRGKYLILRLSHGEALVMHLRMTGALLLRQAPASHEPYCRATFLLDDGFEMCFRDLRKLGRMWLVADENEVVGKLGPEPLHAEFIPEVLAGRLSGHTAPIKAVLLDQEVIAGIGNLYADEILFAAGIHALRPAKGLSREEVLKLHKAIRQVLEEGIARLGASVNTYRRPGGEQGSAHLSFKVARRGGQPCLVCSTPIKRILVRNRGTYFCPRCQPENASPKG